MKITTTLLAALTFVLLGQSGLAQTMDFGRGDVPVTIPEGYNAETAAPLIVLLHGYTSSGARQDAYMGFSDIADDYGYLLVTPDGNRESGGDQNRFWNATTACCNFYGSEDDDVAYIKSIIDTMKAQYNVDEQRVYLVGHSNGGFMSYRMAFAHADSIAAFASLAGASEIGGAQTPSAPINVLQIHGTADGTIAFGGGDIQDNRYPGAVASVRQWAAFNGCAGTGKARELRDLDASLPGYETGVLKFEVGCMPGGSSELWTISSGSHSPILSDTFAEQVVEWLYAHPKPYSR